MLPWWQATWCWTALTPVTYVVLVRTDDSASESIDSSAKPQGRCARQRRCVRLRRMQQTQERGRDAEQSAGALQCSTTMRPTASTTRTDVGLHRLSCKGEASVLPWWQATWRWTALTPVTYVVLVQTDDSASESIDSEAKAQGRDAGHVRGAGRDRRLGVGQHRLGCKGTRLRKTGQWRCL